MNHKEYLQKLQGFNQQRKYWNEINYMQKIMDLKPGELVLDYGAGTGYMAEQLRARTGAKVYAYDIHDQYYLGDPDYFKTSLHFYVDKIYFMHSLAHIENPADTLKLLADKFLKNNGMMYILTPNAEWIEFHKDENYEPDPTVLKHYDAWDMHQLMMGAEAEEVWTNQPDPETDLINNERLIISAKFNSL